jgi:phosphate starvation-inducible PhoH-like protein
MTSKRRRKQKFVAERSLLPRTPNQASLIEAIYEKDMVITTGYAGTGKTYVATTLAAELYDLGVSNGGIDKIILTRPNVGAGPSLRFRPGDLAEKMQEWFAEQQHILVDVLGADTVEIAIRRGNIEMVPFETMRGRSFDNAMILLDEAQNTTPSQMKMAVTRIGENSTYVVNGDLQQSDLMDQSGLGVLIDIVTRYRMDIPVIHFGVEDIVRSDLCRDFIINWDSYEIERGITHGGGLHRAA